MSKQPEALRLADCVADLDYTTRVQALQAALCLRRLHEENRQHREVMRMALDWLIDEQDGADEDCGEQACGDCMVVRKRQVVIDALRAALGERDD